MKAKISKKLMYLSLLIVTVMTFMSRMVFHDTITGSAEEISDAGAETVLTDESSVEVVSYIDVFQSYYDVVLDEAVETGNSNICTFEEFCDKYYYSGMDIQSYTNSVILNDETSSETSILSPGDADYILPQVDYSYTPANVFARQPVYDLYDYSSVLSGDIVHETKTILFNAGHTAIIYDMSKSGGYGSYIQTMEAVGSGVTFGFIDDARMVDFGVIILRVSGATTSKVGQAKYFCRQQLGKSYFLNILRLNTDINSTSWYCSEMIYAAYNYAGIDIGVKKDGAGNDVYLSLGCIPGDIYNSYNTYSVHISGFLDISVVSKASGKWTIAVSNNHNYGIAFEYNTKMCFKGDAESWSGLNHIASASVAAGSSVNVVISENVFANSSHLAGSIKGNGSLHTDINLALTVL